MIKLDISQAVTLYLFISVLGLLLLWIHFEFCGKTKFRASTKGYIWHCDICSYTYVDSAGDYLSVCPQCGSYNRREEGVKHDH